MLALLAVTALLTAGPPVDEPPPPAEPAAAPAAAPGAPPDMAPAPVASAPATVPPPPDAKPAARAARRVLALPLRSDGVSVDQARIVSDTLYVTLSKFRRFEVLSAEDVRRALELQADKDALGQCDDSCLASLAGALDADLVFYGNVGKLENTYILNLNLFDARAQRSVGRETARALSLDALLPKSEQAVAKLLHEPVPDLTPVRRPVNGLAAGITAGAVGVCTALPAYALCGVFGPAGLCVGAPCLAATSALGAGAGIVMGDGLLGDNIAPIAIAAGSGFGAGLVIAIASIIPAVYFAQGKTIEEQLVADPRNYVVGIGLGVAGGIGGGVVAGLITGLLMKGPLEDPTAATHEED